MKRFNKIRKTVVFYDYYERLKNMALSVFEWHGLPETCNPRFLEKCLYEDGQAILVNDELFGMLNLRCTPASELNVYEEPTSYTAFSVGYNKIFPADECVYIRNNYLSKSTDAVILLFAERLAKIELSLMVNINAQKTPILIRADEKTRKSLETIYNMYEGDKPVIFGAKGLMEKPFEVLRTDAPFMADKLREEKRAVWNEALEFLGINTNPSDKKKERLIVDEVNTNNEQIDLQAETMLLTRQQACERMNTLFGLNVSVTRRVQNIKESEVIENG